MGYTHGTRWTDEKIKEDIFNIISVLEINRMPSSVEIERITRDNALTNVIARRGGINKWAKKLGLNQSKCETRIGESGECFVKELLQNKGYIAEKMSVKHPYDLLINKNVKIDVKTSNIFISSKGWSSYSFNLEKSKSTCDIYVFICMEDKKPNKILVIPSKFLHQTQVCITNNESKYDIYKDKWEYIEQYNEFYKNIV